MKKDDSPYIQMGIAAMLPGMVRAAEVLLDAIDEARNALAAYQNGGARGRKADKELAQLFEPDWRSKAATRRASSYWAKMTPAQRSAEMARRGMKGRGKKNKFGPRDAEWLAAQTAGARKSWGELTPKEKAARVARAKANGGATLPPGVAGKNHPANPNHPGHAAWVKKIKAAKAAAAAARAASKTQHVNGAVA